MCIRDRKGTGLPPGLSPSPVRAPADGTGIFLWHSILQQETRDPVKTPLEPVAAVVHAGIAQLAFAETEMEKARQRLDASKAELLYYQDNNNVLDPQAQAQAASTLVNTLMGQKIQMEDVYKRQSYHRATGRSTCRPGKNAVFVQRQTDS